MRTCIERHAERVYGVDGNVCRYKTKRKDTAKKVVTATMIAASTICVVINPFTGKPTTMPTERIVAARMAGAIVDVM